MIIELVPLMPSMRRILCVNFLNHTNGSSHGKTRLIRTAYFHDPYVPLTKRAFELWGQAQAESGRKLIMMIGALLFGLPDSQEVTSRFPMFQMDDDEVAFYEEGAGILFPEECIQAHATLADKQARHLVVQNQQIQHLTFKKWKLNSDFRMCGCSRKPM